MQKRNLKYLKFPLRHKLISYVRDIDVKGFRKLSILLPKWLLPKPKKIGEHIIRTIYGFKLIIDPSIDNGVELSLFQTGTYEKGILSFIENNFNGGGCFIDVGANIGLMSVFTANKFPKAKIIAFEAQPDTFVLLKENIAINNIVSIDARHCALGNENGNVSIYDNWQINRGGASIVVKDTNSNAHLVKIQTLDNAIGDTLTEMIKIDVEGFELEVLKGAQHTIRKYLPVIIVEISTQRVNKHASSGEIIEFIKGQGNYRIYKLAGGKERRSKLIEVVSIEDLPEHDNIICIAKK